MTHDVQVESVIAIFDTGYKYSRDRSDRNRIARIAIEHIWSVLLENKNLKTLTPEIKEDTILAIDARSHIVRIWRMTKAQIAGKT